MFNQNAQKVCLLDETKQKLKLHEINVAMLIGIRYFALYRRKPYL